MISFAWPWLLAAWPLPLLIRRLCPPCEAAPVPALRFPGLAAYDGLDSRVRFLPNRKTLWAALVAWSLLVTAAARPVHVGDPVELPVKGRDILLAVDLSGSMETEDFVVAGNAVDRLTATKAVAGEFIDRRIGDRIGLILFGRQAYVQAPLTFDRQTVRTFLDEAAIGLAGKETAIGNAIALAVKRLAGDQASQRVVILMTDGANTAGELPPLKAAELAAEEKIRIYTLGIGADEMILRSFFGSRRVNPSRDLDEGTLKSIAETTGGRYFRARDAEELQQIYTLIDQLEPVASEAQVFRPTRELFVWPAGLALILAALLYLGKARREGRL